MKRFTLLLALALLLSGCGWHDKSESTSPNGINKVVLLQQRVLEMGGGLELEFLTDSKIVHKERIIGDVYLNFIEYTWSQNSGRVGVFIAAMPEKGFAYDFGEQKEIPFDEMRNQMASKIRAKYGLSRTEDPFDCIKCRFIFTSDHPSETTH